MKIVMPVQGDGKERYMDGTHNRNVLDNVRRMIAAGDNDVVLRNRAIEFVDTLEDLFVRMSVGIDPPRIPMDLGHAEVYLEMILRHLRMGFVIDADSFEDGWFLVLDDSLGGEDFIGRMDSLDETVCLLNGLVRYCSPIPYDDSLSRTA